MRPVTRIRQVQRPANRCRESFRPPAYSALMPCSTTKALQRARSRSRWAPHSCRVPPTGATPCASSCAISPGASCLCHRVVDRRDDCRGRLRRREETEPAGDIERRHAGFRRRRHLRQRRDPRRPVTMKPSTLPACTWPTSTGIASNIRSTCPPRRSLSAGAPDYSGTLSASMRAVLVSSVTASENAEPLPPGDANTSLPGLFFACATRPATVVNGRSLRPTKSADRSRPR